MRASFGRRLIHAIPILVKDTEQARIEYTEKTGELYQDTKLFGWIRYTLLILVIFATALGYLRSNFGWFQLKNPPSEDDYYRSAISCGIDKCHNSDCLLIYTKLFPNGKYKDEIFSVLEHQRVFMKCDYIPYKPDFSPALGHIKTPTPSETQLVPELPRQQQKTISAISANIRNEGLRSQIKSSISIYVNTDGTGSVGDRAAVYLKDWLIQHGFNITDDDAVLDVSITGNISDHRNYDRSRDEASANLHLFMKWGDGETYFDQDIPLSTRTAPFADTAKDLAFSDATSRLLEEFRKQIQH